MKQSFTSLENFVPLLRVILCWSYDEWKEAVFPDRVADAWLDKKFDEYRKDAARFICELDTETALRLLDAAKRKLDKNR